MALWPTVFSKEVVLSDFAFEWLKPSTLTEPKKL